MVAAICPDCGDAVIEVTIGSGPTQLNETPDSSNGQVVLVGETGVMLIGPMLGQARRAGLKTYRRHGTTCTKWWEGRLNR